MLELLGYRVSLVENGHDAVAIALHAPVDLILMDCQMPKMDGFAATEAIRLQEQGPHRSVSVPIIALTANAMDGDRQRCLAAGMDDYLSKPIKADILQDMLLRHSAAAPRATVFVESDVVALGAGDAAALEDVNAFDYARAMRQQDMEMIEIVAEVFIAQWPHDRAKMQANWAGADWVALGHTVHALKGTLNLFGAQPAAELAAQLESAAGQGLGADLQAGLELLCAEVGKVVLALQRVVPGVTQQGEFL